MPAIPSEESIEIDPIGLAVLNMFAGLPLFECGWSVHQPPADVSRGRSIVLPVQFLLECGAPPDGTPSTFKWSCSPAISQFVMKMSPGSGFTPSEAAAFALSLP